MCLSITVGDPDGWEGVPILVPVLSAFIASEPMLNTALKVLGGGDPGGGDGGDNDAEE